MHHQRVGLLAHEHVASLELNSTAERLLAGAGHSTEFRLLFDELRLCTYSQKVRTDSSVYETTQN